MSIQLLSRETLWLELSMEKIIIDCDIGNTVAGANVDDSFAIALAMASKNLELLAVTTVTGNTKNSQAYAVAKDLFKKTNFACDVFCGEERALQETYETWRTMLDKSVDNFNLRYLWDSLDQIQDEVNPNCNAVDKLIELSKKYAGDLTIVAIGPLTNIASAIQRDPSFAQRIKQIVLMGGLFNVPRYIKDTNFGLDPEAANIVLTSSIPVVMAPFDTTSTTLFTQENLEQLGQIKNSLCQYLYKTVAPWLEYSIKTRNINGFWIHDVLTIAYLIDDSIFTCEDGFVNIELQGAFRGRCYRVDDGYIKNGMGLTPQAPRKIKIMQAVNNKALLDLIINNLKNYR